MPVAAPLRLSLRAPAKVNLFLEVVGKRPDGYHDLRMFVAPVSLCDELDLELVPGGNGVEVTCTGLPEVPGGERNLCHTAVRFYLEEVGLRAAVRVRVRKRVPAGAGLGGGSSDAAATLLGLERLTGRPLSAEARARAAFRVGADVPFFFVRSPAWVTGIGERVKAVRPTGPLWLVLVYPGVFLPTGQVFSRFTQGLTTPDHPHTIAQFNFQGFVEGLRNDLQAAATALEPAVAQALEAVAAAGAPGSLMSGSGSAVFGLFRDERAARRAAGLVQGDPRANQWRVDVVHTLPPGAFPFRDGRDPDWGVDKR